MLKNDLKEFVQPKARSRGYMRNDSADLQSVPANKSTNLDKNLTVTYPELSEVSPAPQSVAAAQKSPTLRPQGEPQTLMSRIYARVLICNQYQCELQTVKKQGAVS